MLNNEHSLKLNNVNARFSLYSAGQAAVREFYTVDLVQPWWRLTSGGPPVRKDLTGKNLAITHILVEVQRERPHLKYFIVHCRSAICCNLSVAILHVPTCFSPFQKKSRRSRVGDLEKNCQGLGSHCCRFSHSLSRLTRFIILEQN